MSRKCSFDRMKQSIWKYAISLCFSLSFWNISIAQEAAKPIYNIDWNKEVTIGAASCAMLGTSLWIDHRRPAITLDDLSLLSTDNIPRIDRIAIGKMSSNADLISDGFLVINSLLPSSYFFLNNKQDRNTIIMMYGEVVALNGGITFLTKSLSRRYRPYAYNTSFDIEERTRNKARRSFFSGHTSQSAALSFFTAKVFHDLFPDSKYVPYVWTAAAILPMSTAYHRFQAGMHFPTDLIAGYIAGGLVGILIPTIHKDKRLQSISLNAGVGMVSLNYSF